MFIHRKSNNNQRGQHLYYIDINSGGKLRKSKISFNVVGMLLIALLISKAPISLSLRPLSLICNNSPISVENCN